MSQSAQNTASEALWSHFINYYRKAYDIALRRLAEQQNAVVSEGTEEESDIEENNSINNHYQTNKLMKVQVSNANTPVWRDITVESRMPAQLNILQEMARNIWWVWNNEALSMFKSIDPEIWKAVNGNPVMLLNRVSYERLEEIVADKSMMYTINAQYENSVNISTRNPKAICLPLLISAWNTVWPMS